MANNLTTEQMVTALYHWAFGSGGKGVEARLAHLEKMQTTNVTQRNLGHAEDDITRRIEALAKQVTEGNTAMMQRIIDLHKSLMKWGLFIGLGILGAIVTVLVRVVL